MGLTRYVRKEHIARAVLEATAYQSREVVEAMNKDSGQDLVELRVDGGMTANELLMQFQADQLNVPVIRPKITETLRWARPTLRVWQLVSGPIWTRSPRTGPRTSAGSPTARPRTTTSCSATGARL